MQSVEPNPKHQDTPKKEKKKDKKQVSNVQFDEDSRRSFLLGIKNKKKRKEKKAKIMAKEALRKARADLRNEKKEQREVVVNELITRQYQLGITPLSIFLQGSGGPEMEFIQVDPNKPSNDKRVEEEEEEEEKPEENK